MAKRQFCVQASYRGHQGGQVILSAPRSPRGAGPGPQLGLWYPCAPLSSELEERTSSSWFTREPRKQQWGQDTDKVVVWHGIQLQVFAPLWVLLFPVHLRSLLTRAMSFFPLPSWEVLIGSEINITSHVSWEYLIDLEATVFHVTEYTVVVAVVESLSCARSVAQALSRVWLFATQWTTAHQAPLSMAFPRQEYWRGCSFFLQEIFPTQGWNLRLLLGRQILYHRAPREAP